MDLSLVEIPLKDFDRQKERLHMLIRAIWEEDSSAMNAIHSVDRWGKSKNESGGYFFIMNEGRIIGLTGYFKVPGEGNYGLRHHGTLIKGTGKLALDLLIEFLHVNFPDFKRLVELMPEDKDELVTKFEEWGFKRIDDPDLSWEPKKDYYKIMMLREYEG